MLHTNTLYVANLGSRFVAWVIDLFVEFLIVLLLLLPMILSYTQEGQTQMRPGLVFASLILFPLAFLLPIAYQTYGLHQYGQTLGKWAMRIKVVNADGKKPSFGVALLRTLCAFYLSPLFFFAGFWWAFLNKERRTWHDLICDTRVVEV